MLSAIRSFNCGVYGSLFLAMFYGLAVVSVVITIGTAFVAADLARNISPNDPRFRVHPAYPLQYTSTGHVRFLDAGARPSDPCCKDLRMAQQPNKASQL